MAIWKLSGLFEIADIASFSLQNAETVKGTYMRVNSHGKRRHKRQITASRTDISDDRKRTKDHNKKI